MEVLDASVANVSLPHMAGSLSASNDEATSILTSCLVSNGIVGVSVAALTPLVFPMKKVKPGGPIAVH